MHLARTILTGLCAAMALLAGFFAAAVAILAIGAFMLLRLFGRSRSLRAAPARRRPVPWTRPDGAIDVSATEVPVPDADRESAPR